MNGWRSKLGSTARGYGDAWQRLRLVVLKRAGYMCECAECRRTGRVRLADQVDHVKPKAAGGTDELGNLRAMNRECHRLKTIADSGGKPRQAIGLDGFPVR